jgi:PKD repeat protein
MQIANDVRSRRGRGPGLAVAGLVLGLALGAPLRLEAQCSIAGGPVLFDPPAVVLPHTLNFNPRFDSLALFQNGAGAYRVVDRYNYGYAVFSLSNPLSPSLLGALDFHVLSGWQNSHDGQTNIGTVGAAPDGSSLLVGYMWGGHATVVMAPGTADGSFIVQGKEFLPEWGTMNSGGMRVDKIGPRSIAYMVESGIGLYAADITDGAAGTTNTNGDYDYYSEAIAKVPVTDSVLGLDLAVNAVNGERYVVYSTGLDQPGSRIVVVNVTNPGAAGAGITRSFVTTILLPENFGLPAGSNVRRARAAFHPTKHTLEILVEATKSSGESAGIALGTFDTLNHVISNPRFFLDPTSSFMAPKSGATTSGPALIPTADDLLAFVWEMDRTSMKLFTLSSNSWGTDLSPKVTFPTNTTPYFRLGNSYPPMITEGWSDGQNFYLVTGGWSNVTILKVACQMASGPATSSLSITNSAGASVTSAFIGDTVKLTRNVSPAPVASTTTALTSWDMDFDYHNSTETYGSYPILQSPDVRKSETPKSVAGVSGLVTDPVTYPAELSFTGPCDPRYADGKTCWQSVATTTDFSALTGISPVTSPYVIRMEDEGVKTASTVFAFEAANVNTTGTSSTGSANLATLPITWKVPRVLIQKGSPNSTVADATPAAESQTILVGDMLYNASEGSPSLSGYSWYFETAPGNGVFGAPECGGPSCLHDFASAVPANTPRPWSFAYWLTVPYPNGYVSEDYPAGVARAPTTRKRGTIAVSDVVLNITAPSSIVKSQTLFTLTNQSSKGASILGCTRGAVSELGAYQYAICQGTLNTPCAIQDSDYKDSVSLTTGTGNILTPVPATYPGYFFLQIRYQYSSASGGCTTPSYAYWPSPSTAWPLTVTNVMPGIDIRSTSGTSYRSCSMGNNCPTTGQPLKAVAVDKSVYPWTDLIDPTFTWTFAGATPATGIGSPYPRPGSPDQPFSYSTTGNKTVTLTAYGATTSTDTFVNSSAPSPTPTPTPTPSPTPTPTPPPSGTAPSISSFSASPSSVQTGQAVTFNCSASGSPTPSYLISFGTFEGTSPSPYTSHTYSTAGNYTTNCTATNSSGSDSHTQVVQVTPAVQVWNPTIRVWVNDKDPCIGNPYCVRSPFSATVGDPLTAYAWDQTTSAMIPAGAGTFDWTFSNASPKKGSVQGFSPFYYSQPGTYLNDVQLVFTPNNGTAASTIKLSATIAPPPFPPVTLQIQASPSNGVVGGPIAFTATAGGGSGTYSSYTWDFGDQSGTGTGATTSYAYKKAGTFTVTCTVKDSAGTSKSATTSVTISSVQLWLVPGVAWVSGQGGAEWQSDLSIFNPSPTSAMNVQVAFLDGTKSINSIADLNGKWQMVSVPKQATKAYTNLISSLFNLAQGNYGALLIRGDSSVATQPVVTGSTYDTSRGAGGTVGLSLAATLLPSGAGAGIQTAGSTIDLVGLRDDVNDHTNLAIANLYSDYVTAEVTLWGPDGIQLGQLATMQLNPFGVQQLTNVLTAAPPGGAGYDKAAKPVDSYRARIRIVSGTAILPYASVIDDVSKAPTLVTGANIPTSSYRIPGIVRTEGMAGTLWRSDLVVYNPSASTRLVRIAYSWVDGSGSPHTKLGYQQFAPGQIFQWVDFVKLWLLLPDTDTSPYINSFVDVSPYDTNADPILVTARVYNNTPTGNVGLGVAGYTDADVASASGSKTRLILAGLRSDANYRTNVALFLASGSSVSNAGATLKVYDANGTFLTSAGIGLTAASSFIQLSIDGMVAGTVGDKSNISVVVENLEGPPISGYATIVDNRSGSPTLIPALPIP